MSQMADALFKAGLISKEQLDAARMKSNQRTKDQERKMIKDASKTPVRSLEELDDCLTVNQFRQGVIQL